MNKKSNEHRDKLAYDFDKSSWYGRSSIDYFNTGFDEGVKFVTEQVELKLKNIVNDMEDDFDYFIIKNEILKILEEFDEQK